jgi:hypothetical protein
MVRRVSIGREAIIGILVTIKKCWTVEGILPSNPSRYSSIICSQKSSYGYSGFFERGLKRQRREAYHMLPKPVQCLWINGAKYNLPSYNFITYKQTVLSYEGSARVLLDACETRSDVSGQLQFACRKGGTTPHLLSPSGRDKECWLIVSLIQSCRSP